MIVFALYIFFWYFYQQIFKQWIIKEMQSVYKSVVTDILCISQEVTEAKPIISITVNLFVLIQLASQQVSQPPTLTWRLKGCWIN